MEHALAFRCLRWDRAFVALFCRIALAIIATTAVSALRGQAHAEQASLQALAVLPFEIEDTSGEVGPANRHDAMLSRATTLVRDEIAAAQLYRVVPENLTEQAVAAVNSGTYLRRCNGCEIDIAKRVGARYVLVGWIYKVSTLVLTLHIDIKDVMTGKPVYARVFDFRGDNEPAYAHAAKTLVRSLTNELPVPPVESGARQERTDPIKIAVFDFELEDLSGTGASPVEANYLAQATEEAKRKLVGSGRYTIVDTGAADLAAAQGHGMRNCRGCDGAIATKLGADQDIVGVVTKISMTEYTVTVQVSDARRGAAINTFTTGLRMGADYSWVRGVTWLMKNRVLASREQP
jgi:uncharacterized protein DUF2380